ncbi:MAG: cohesin domain-containing protein, partial [Desulfuromonadaceae bacterium]
MSYVNLIVRTLFVFLLLVFSAHAATISVIPSGPAAFSVEGAGMDGVAGIQFDITYDTASLGTPTVTQGGLITGAMFAANTTSRPGLIKVAIIRTTAFSGSGQIAKIS